ncbi:hypothetical protein EGW08_006050 [Elysia chlorotica]|uniref:Uncharacterized protein n=1 Tax=Elysia chlorotica TaxID=188477 RepID=A0A433TX77_ELYCH|nr:hypothetical protein EGW08_006050 [Elysia chlorotica]
MQEPHFVLFFFPPLISNQPRISPDEGSCWYLPSDRGYAPAHLLASHRGRNHRHHHHHHHRRRRRPGMSAPLGHGFNRNRRALSTSTPTTTTTTTTHGSVGHRAASSCGSSSVFTKGSASNKSATVHSNMYVHYEKRGKGGRGGSSLPARRHSHGSLYNEQQQQHHHQHQQHQQQHVRDIPRRLFDYSPSSDRRQYTSDADAEYYSLRREHPELPRRKTLSYNDHYDSEDNNNMAPMPKANGNPHTEPEFGGGPSSRQRLSIPKHRKRRRSSTHSVQSNSSFTKLSKLRSELNDAMAISRRLMGTWSVDSVHVSAFGGSGGSGQIQPTSAYLPGTSSSSKRVSPKSKDKSRRQTVIGIQGIADSILESYNFQKTEDNHSFVYDCITPRRYASSPNKAGKSSPSCSNRKMSRTECKEQNTADCSNRDGVFSFNFYDRPNQQQLKDFESIESGLKHSNIELSTFQHEAKKMNGFENPNYANPHNECNPSNIYVKFGNNINHPPSSVLYKDGGSAHALNSFDTCFGNPNQVDGSNCKYEKDMSAFYQVRAGYKDNRNVPDPGPPEPSEQSEHRQSNVDHLVFLPPRNVSLQSIVNQAHAHSNFDNRPRETSNIDNGVGSSNTLPAYVSQSFPGTSIERENLTLQRSPRALSENTSVKSGSGCLVVPHCQFSTIPPPENSVDFCTASQRRSSSRSVSPGIGTGTAQRVDARRLSPQPTDRAEILSPVGLFSYSLGGQEEGHMRRNDSFA